MDSRPIKLRQLRGMGERSIGDGECYHLHEAESWVWKITEGKMTEREQSSES